ncbi:MAG: HNH endonuclease [Candidatus Thiodiazotropha taylori]|uniref:HNH endonuclease n=1 Tax=Candidatus Thiodiazotropha taylori TaxID=2792791 RepID=A0A9E4N210_9GAMM|nr:HNH endonuclease [Candidatus Thiodiazotropha taylori]MCW4254945.1 HNH endonuclease [Candidatus Thiodiazotropha taylori]
MNYEKHYNLLIEKYGHSTKPNSGYYEQHHIIPKFKGGTNDKDNLVYLSAKAHIIAHHLLWKWLKCQKSAYAFWMMAKSNQNQQRRMSSRQFVEARKALKYANSLRTWTPTAEWIENRTGENHWFYNKKRPEHSKVMKDKLKNDLEYRSKNIFLNGGISQHVVESNKRRKGEKRNRTERTCVHCGLTGKGPNMTRYHFDNCKHKE